MKTNVFTKTLLSLSLLAATGAANAAAFQLAEVSTSGLGLAYAGNAAVADNASVVANNPALMTKFKSTEVSVGGVYVNGNINISGKTIRGNDATQNDIIPSAFVPNLYVVVPVNERFAVGGGVNVNYGLKSEFDKNYNAGVFGGDTSLTAINLNLSGAYNLGYGFHFGLGFNAVKAKAELNRYNGDMSPALPKNTTVSHLKGEDWGFGWNAGLVYEFNERNRIGVAYHSEIKLDANIDYSNSLPTAFPGGLGSATIPGSLVLRLPAYWEVSTYHKLTDKFAVQFSYKHTDWSSFKELEGLSQNNTRLFHKEENFSNNSRVALGVSYDVLDSLTLRAGIAYDESASVESPSISIPDTDRTWYSVGATYRFTQNLSVDVGYAHLRGKKISFTEVEPRTGYRATFESKSTANLYGLNLNYRF
ncbi:MAG: porin [Lonepinella koalarum]|nr:porin [Lonepinella koalarum]